MDNGAFFGQHAGKYRLVKIVLAGNDCSEAYAPGWKDKGMYTRIAVRLQALYGETPKM